MVTEVSLVIGVLAGLGYTALFNLTGNWQEHFPGKAAVAAALLGYLGRLAVVLTAAMVLIVLFKLIIIWFWLGFLSIHTLWLFRYWRQEYRANSRKV